MRTIVPFASSSASASPPLPPHNNPLSLHMSPTSTTETHEHIPNALHPHDLSRSASPQQSNLSLLVRTASLPLHSFADRVSRFPMATQPSDHPHRQ